MRHWLLLIQVRHSVIRDFGQVISLFGLCLSIPNRAGGDDLLTATQADASRHAVLETNVCPCTLSE